MHCLLKMSNKVFIKKAFESGNKIKLQPLNPIQQKKTRNLLFKLLLHPFLTLREITTNSFQQNIQCYHTPLHYYGYHLNHILYSVGKDDVSFVKHGRIQIVDSFLERQQSSQSELISFRD